MANDTMKDIKLQNCCRQAMKDIAEKQRLGRILHSLVATSPFAVLLGSGPIETAFSLSTTDWDLWREATQAVPSIVKNRCQQIAAFEVLRHSGGPLNKFWRKMHDSFN